MKLEKELVKGSAILLVSFGIYNLFNFLFQSSMARLLSLSDFGVLAFLNNMIYILGGFSESIQMTITKFAANEKEPGKIKNIIKRALRKSLSFCLGLFLFFLIAAIFISKLTKINYFLVAFTGLIIFNIFLMPINRGVLQGKKKFGALGINMISESIAKFLLAVFFVYLGWNVFGAILATFLAGAIAFYLTFIGLKEYTRSKEKIGETRGIYSYSKPTFFIVLTILIFYGFDIIFAKLVFSSEIAGTYAIASLCAKMIFLVTQPVSKVMFPIAVENNKGKKKSKNVFLNAFVTVLVLDLIALGIFYFYPEFVLGIFSGKSLTEDSKALFYLGVSITMLSITNLILIRKLSLDKIKRPRLFFSLVLVLLAAFYLSTGMFVLNLTNFSFGVTILSLIFLIISILFK